MLKIEAKDLTSAGLKELVDLATDRVIRTGCPAPRCTCRRRRSRWACTGRTIKGESYRLKEARERAEAKAKAKRERRGRKK